MGLLDGLQSLIENVTGSAQDAAGSITENLPTDEVTNAVEGAKDSATNASEELTTKAEDIKNSIL